MRTYSKKVHRGPFIVTVDNMHLKHEFLSLLTHIHAYFM